MSIKSKSNSIGSGGSDSRTDSNLKLNDDTAHNHVVDAATTTTSRARLCHLRKWANFQGYGFNLHAEKAKQGQHIGKVDVNSPAESAGLKVVISKVKVVKPLQYVLPCCQQFISNRD